MLAWMTTLAVVLSACTTFSKGDYPLFFISEASFLYGIFALFSAASVWAALAPSRLLRALPLLAVFAYLVASRAGLSLSAIRYHATVLARWPPGWSARCWWSVGPDIGCAGSGASAARPSSRLCLT